MAQTESERGGDKMPERRVIVGDTETIVEYANLVTALNDGWVLDPLFNSKPIRLDNAVIYHLIKYAEGEEPQEPETPKVESVKSVGYEEVDDLIKQGYQPRDYYAKSVTLIKMRGESDAT